MLVTNDPIRSAADLRGRRTLVLGLARSGTAAARMLADAGAAVTAYDRRPAAELRDAIDSLGGRAIELVTGDAVAEATRQVAAAELIVTSPSVSPDLSTTDPWLREALVSARERGIELISEMELFLRLTVARVLAVTGTKGKTTTTAMLGSIFAAARVPHAVGGNIGQPLVEQATTLAPTDWAIVELSELQLPTISRGAEIAVYTNIAADHLDRHGSLDAYRAVKARLAELTAPRGMVVLNADDPGCRDLASRLPASAVAWYGVDPGVDRSVTVADGRITVRGRPIMATDDLRLPGRHMLANALAAALAADLAGIALDAVAAGLRGFGGVAHRLELLGEWDEVRWVNDSQATIPLAAMEALDAYAPAPVILIAGGKDKGLSYDELGDRVAGRCAAAILIGETAADLERAIGGRVTVRHAAGMEEAVALAAALAPPGSVVLLAPAAASFDMFTDYAARGDAFRAAVLGRAAEHRA